MPLNRVGAAVIGAVSAAAIAVPSALAATSSDSQIARVTTSSAGAVTAVKVARSSDRGPAFCDTGTDNDMCEIRTDSAAGLPGASAQVRVARGATALLLVRFMGNGSAGSGEIDVVVDGREAQPDNGSSGVVLERSIEVGAGRHNVNVKVNPGGLFRIDGWRLTVEKVSQS